MMEMVWQPETLGWIAGLIFVTGYLIINQVILRILIIIGTVFYIAYYATAAEDPLWVAIYMSTAQGFATAIGLGLLFLRRSRLAIPRAYSDIYPRFPHLPPGDFRALMRHANRYVATRDEPLGIAGQPVEKLAYIVQGSADVEKHDEHFAVPGGIFIGEVAFLLDQPAAATTVLKSGSEVIIWNKADLQNASARNPRFQLALEAAISRDMAAKVALAVAPAQMRQKTAAPFDIREPAQ